MFLHEPIYDLDILSRSNLHIHTNFSRCGKPEMRLCAILQEAEKSGLQRIALTDHSPIEGSFLAQIHELKAQAAAIETPVKILFGAELSAYGVGKSSESFGIRAALDYRLYSYNHYHQEFWEFPQEQTPEGFREHAFAILRALFQTGEADCIAHPFYGRFLDALNDPKDATRAISDTQLGDIMREGTAAKVAWELNTGAIRTDPEFYRRYFAVGKEIGAVFNFGTDAHRLEGIDPKQFLPDLKRILY